MPSGRLQDIPQGLKPAVLLAIFGTTEVVPFHKTIYATRSSVRQSTMATIRP